MDTARAEEYKWYAVGAVVIAAFVVVAIAYDVPSYYKSYQFTHAVALEDQSGTVVFYLSDGGTINLTNEWTRDDAAGNVTGLALGGVLKVGYSFIGFPVSATYSP